MEVARLARIRGHDVTLYEKEAELGGQVLLAARLPRRDEIGGVARWLARELERIGVKTVLGTAVTAEQIAGLGADAVVVATGASFLRSGLSGVLPAPIPGSDGDAAVTPEMILRAELDPGPVVVILDTEGREIAPGLAELLASRGRKVTIVTAFPFVAPKLAEEVNLPHVYGRLFELGVEMLPNHWAKEIGRGEVALFNVYAPTQERRLPANHVVMVAARCPSDDLYVSLKGKVKELCRVGDCVAPGDIGTAMLDAHRLGRGL